MKVDRRTVIQPPDPSLTDVLKAKGRWLGGGGLSELMMGYLKEGQRDVAFTGGLLGRGSTRERGGEGLYGRG